MGQSAVLLRNATPSVFDQRHVGRLRRSSCRFHGRRTARSSEHAPLAAISRIKARHILASITLALPTDSWCELCLVVPTLNARHLDLPNVPARAGMLMFSLLRGIPSSRLGTSARRTWLREDLQLSPSGTLYWPRLHWLFPLRYLARAGNVCVASFRRSLMFPDTWQFQGEGIR